MSRAVPPQARLLAVVIGGALVLFGTFTLRAALRAAPSAISTTHTITLTNDGFTPTKIQVNVGDSVTFTSTAGAAFWPASDPHPVHDLYPAFDPRRPIPATADWSFTFTKAGTWPFHNHLNPIDQGTIIVVNPGAPIASCTFAQAEGGDEGCFEELVRTAVETQGLDAGWAIFKKLFEEGKAPQSCHWTAHFIGQEAYILYREGKGVAISEATSYCGYGFYHGFMEKLLHDDPDPKKALAFCQEVEKQLGTMGLQNCYHGIGHGYTETPPDPAYLGSFKKMVAPGTKMCEFLFGNNFTYLNLCLTGVFTVPAEFAADHEYGLSLNPKDPFAYCKDMPYRYLKACYGEFAPKLDRLLSWDITKLPPYVAALPYQKLQRLVTWVVPAVMMAHDIAKSDQSKYITGCRDSFTGRLRLICWGGSILGFYEHGEPGQQYKQMLSFCASPAWKSDAERTFCYGEGFRLMRAQTNYPDNVIRSACAQIPKQYQPLCFDTSLVSPYDDPSFDSPDTP